MSKTKNTQKLEKPIWLKYTQEEVKAIILKLADKGLSAERIGLVLRDQYGIPKVNLYNLKIGQILKEKNKFKEPTLTNLENKLKKIIGHFKKNKQDKKTGRALIITQAKLKKANEYQARKE
jgi:small subunit ribosomal protein S15